MALTTRQNRFYRYTATFYRQKRDVTTGDEAWVSNLTGIQVGLFSTDNLDQTTVIGKMKMDNLFTLDLLKTEVGLDIRGGDMMKVTANRDSTGTDVVGDWYKIMGDSRGRESHGIRRGNFANYYINLSTDPTPAV